MSSQEEKKSGYIEVIHGPMFARKSSELFRRLRRHHMAGRNVTLIKSKKDNRYGTSDTLSASHDGMLFPAQEVGEITQAATAGYDVIGVDEGQFMGPELTRWAHHMASDCGKIVIVACLDTNFMMDPWENVMALICVAEKNTKLAAICCVCGEDAYFSRKTKDSKGLIEVGGQELYVPTCRAHHSSQLGNTQEYMRRVDSLQVLNKSFDASSINYKMFL